MSFVMSWKLNRWIFQFMSLLFLLYTQTTTALWSCPPGLQVSGRADYPQVLDTRQIWALSSVSVGHPSKPCYRIGARQLAQLAFGKPPGASHGTSFALMVPDKPADQSCLPSQGVRLVQDGRETKDEKKHTQNMCMDCGPVTHKRHRHKN